MNERWDFARLGMGYRTWSEPLQTELRLSHLKRSRDELTGDLAVTTNLVGVKTVNGVLHAARFNVTSSASRSSLAKILASRTPGHDMDWFDALESLCQNVMIAEKRGEPVEVVGFDPLVPASEQFLVEPLVLRDRTAVIFGPPESAKSLIGIVCAVSVGSGREVIPGIVPARKANVLYLDWETTKAQVNERIVRIANGAGLVPSGIFYRRMVRVLADEVEEISELVAENEIAFIVIDSAEAAMGTSGGYGGDANDSTKRLHEAIRLIGATTLIIDHVSKSDARERVGTANPYGCYVEGTEVLTQRGWVAHPDLLPTDDVLAFDPQTHAYRWERPTKYHEYDYDGDLVEWSTKASHARVTPNHRMLVAPGWNAKDPSARFIEASAITKADWKLVASASAPADGTSVDLDRARLLGWYVAEGDISRYARIHSTDPLASRIRNVLTRLSIRFSEMWSQRPERKPIARFSISDARITDWLEGCGKGAANKHLPVEVWTWDIAAREALLEALIDGDGHRASHRSHIYTTISAALADDVQRLAILCGHHADARLRKMSYKGKPYSFYQVNITYGRSFTCFRPDRGSRLVPYSGKVYCLTVPSGAYLTRLEGRIAIHGNSMFKTAYARIMWEARRDPGAPGETKVTLYHTKSNDTEHHVPIVVSALWANGAVTFTSSEGNEVVTEESAATTEDAIRELLGAGAKMQLSQIASALSAIKYDTVKGTLRRMVVRGDVAKDDEGWHSLKVTALREVS